jgi:hypothetical protein
MGQPHSVGQHGNAVPRFGSATLTLYRGRWPHLSGRHGKLLQTAASSMLSVNRWQQDRLRLECELCHATDVNPVLQWRSSWNASADHVPSLRRYLDYTGCGNTLNYNYRIVRSLIMDCLPCLGSRLQGRARSSTLRFVRADTSCRHLL